MHMSILNIASVPARITSGHSIAVATSDDGAVLLDLDTGRLFMTNHVGAMIWQALQAQQDRQAIAATISHEYRLLYAQACEDVNGFLVELRQQRLIDARSRP